MSKTIDLADHTIVVTEKQTKGRGQLGSTWQSKDGQSLTFSIFKRFSNLKIEHQSLITFAVSIGVKNALEVLNIPVMTIKWPNDIMSYSKKLCGILIENQIEGTNITSSIIGVGLNVNNSEFDKLPQASSMKLASGKAFILEEILQLVSEAILKQLETIEYSKNNNLEATYVASLFRKDKVTAFNDQRNQNFNGIIRGVDSTGHLLLETENEEIKSFELKQLKMLF